MVIRQSYTLQSVVTFTLKMLFLPWLVWLSGLSAGLQTKGSLVDSQSGHMPGWQAGSPVGGAREATIH